MSGLKNKTCEKNIRKIILNVLKSVIPFLVTSGILLGIYRNYLEKPKISCIPKEEKDTFSVEKNFRGVSMKIYPQMIVQYDRYIVLVTHLNGYYENDSLIFEEGKCEATKMNQEYLKKMMDYIRKEIILGLEKGYGTDISSEIDSDLYVYVSLLGGVKYTNKRGNNENMYCIIERDGIVIDYSIDANEIKERLYEYEVDLQSSSLEMEKDDDIQKMINVIKKEVKKAYDDKVRNG